MLVLILFLRGIFLLYNKKGPLSGGGRYKFLQVDWLLPIHGPKATALRGPLCEVEARGLVLSSS